MCTEGDTLEILVWRAQPWLEEEYNHDHFRIDSPISTYNMQEHHTKTVFF